MFYDFQRAYSPSWLELSEAIFSEFGLEPTTAVGATEQQQSNGAYRRVKKRLMAFLKMAAEGAEPNIRIDSRWDDSDALFCPCGIRIAFSSTNYGLRNGVVAVRQDLVTDVATLVDRIGDLVLTHTGTAYAHAFDFPLAYGPDYYLLAVGAVPTERTSREDEAYVARITRWRDNTWHRGLRPSQGYFREVYPINLVMQAHLDRQYKKHRLSEYMAEVGSLTKVSGIDGMYRWYIDEERLFEVREELEPSGLVLSACTDRGLEVR